MGKVNINDPKTTTTARGDRSDELQRERSLERAHIDFAENSKVERNVGVNMDTKDKAGAKNKNSGQNKNSNIERQNGQKQRNAQGGRPRGNQYNRPKQLALPAGTESGGVKKNILVHDELDSGMALMASRTAATEYQRPDITKIKQQRGKSMSGLVMDVSRSHMRPVENGNMKASAASGTEKEKANEGNTEEKEKFSRTWSTLIGVGVALVVAVVGFAAIAIFGGNKEKCIVAFESNGGSKVESTEIVCGRTVSEPTTPTKEGFEFDGWIFEGDPFDFSTEIYKNATLVAKWKADENTEIVTVTFDTDGGTAISPVEVAKGKTMHAPNDPVKANWAFSGWYYDGKEFDFSRPIEQDMTLKANWKWSPASSGNSNNSRPSGNTGSSNNNGGNTSSGGNNNGNGNTTVDDQNDAQNKPNGGNSGDSENKPPISGGDNTGDNTGGDGSGSTGGNTGGDGSGNSGEGDGNGDGDNSDDGTGGDDGTGDGNEGGSTGDGSSGSTGDGNEGSDGSGGDGTTS